MLAAVCIIGATLAVGSLALPLLEAPSWLNNATIQEISENINGTSKNYYVVKAVVYEVGILTEGNDTDTSFESQERVDLTFFDAHTNETHIDLGQIPLPIQTNVSGQVITGIAPVRVGAYSSPEELLSALPITATIVNITHSDTAFYQLSTSNASSANRIHHDSDEKADGND